MDIYGVKVCNNKSLNLLDEPLVLDRDVNASINILNLFLYMNSHKGERLKEFKRNKNVIKEPITKLG